MSTKKHARLHALGRRAHLGVLIAIGLSGCVQRPDGGRRASSGDSQPTSGIADSLPIRRFEESYAAIYRYTSGVRDSTFTVIRDGVRWEEMWRRLSAQHGPPRPPPPIDFEREMALVATQGVQRSGGYTIAIEAAIDRGSHVEAHVSRHAPGPSCGVIAMLTTPADIAIVPRREVEVRMTAHDHVTDCSAR